MALKPFARSFARLASARILRANFSLAVKAPQMTRLLGSQEPHSAHSRPPSHRPANSSLKLSRPGFGPALKRLG